MSAVRLAFVILGVLICSPGAAQAQLAAEAREGVVLVGPGGVRTTLAPKLSAPAWSPDGTQVIAVEEISEERSQLRVVDVERRTSRALAGTANLGEPSWSPDGTAIVAASSRTEGDTRNGGLVIVPASGGTPRRLTSDAYDTQPAWSPDGRTIAFTRVTFGRTAVSYAVRAVGPDGSGLRTLAAEASGAAWSPDGTRLAYASVRDRNGETCFDACFFNAELYVSAADGTGAQRLTRTTAIEEGPSWSPDGTRLAFASSRHHPRGNASEVWTVDADGRCPTQVTWGPGAAGSPDWRPGGSDVLRGPCDGRLVGYDDVIDVGAVRVPDAVPLFLGRSFAGRYLDAGYGTTLVYAECGAADPERCGGEIQLQTFTTCRRNPSRFEEPVTSVQRIRGALVVGYGDSYEILSGGTTTVAFGVTPGLLRPLLAALQPVRGPRLSALPAPRLPAVALRRLRRSASGRPAPLGYTRAEMVRSDRRVLRVLARFGATSRRAPACAR